MSELRILQVAHDHPDWTAGGTEIVAHDLARALDDRAGVACRLLVAATEVQRPGAGPGRLGAHGRDLVLQTGAYDRFSMLRLDGSDWLESLAHVVRSVGPEVVHLHGLDRIGAAVIPALRRLAPDCRIVLTLHDYQLICPNEGLLLTVGDDARCRGAQPDRCRRCFPELGASRHALRRAHLLALVAGVDAFVAPSAFLRDRFVAWGLDANRILLLPNAVAVPERRPDEPARERRDRFAFFGTLAPHKGVLVLLDAAARLRPSEGRVAIHGGFRLADDGFRGAFGEALAAARPTAEHFGPYDRSDVGALMRRADWVVVPSTWWENAPLVIEEARAAGRPVICSDIGGMAENVREGMDGLHFPAGDAAALAETMRAASDAALWRRLAAGAAPAPHAAFVDAHIDLYQRLMTRMAA
jgi:glycosyltransferase involved in cell wall biosynthesis